MSITLDQSFKIFNASDISRSFGVSYPTSLKIIKRVGGVRIGKRFFCTQEALENFLNSGKDVEHGQTA